MGFISQPYAGDFTRACLNGSKTSVMLCLEKTLLNFFGSTPMYRMTTCFRLVFSACSMSCLSVLFLI